jgi:hypothetical protein
MYFPTGSHATPFTKPECPFKTATISESKYYILSNYLISVNIICSMYETDPTHQMFHVNTKDTQKCSCTSVYLICHSRFRNILCKHLLSCATILKYFSHYWIQIKTKISSPSPLYSS